MKREYSLPAELEKKMALALESLGYQLSDSKKLAEAVLKLSDVFISSPDFSTPWKEKWAQAAYLSYFLPLNFLRNQAVIEQGLQKKFFDGLARVIDFGAGPGTASLALEKLFPKNNFLLIEKSSEAVRFSQQFFGGLSFASEVQEKTFSKTLGVFSYSLTELSTLPNWAYDCEALMIIEPATQDDGRKLQELRKDLLNKGFFAWAPCTHQEDCPLLLHSKKDWCHDRIFFNAPLWFQKIEDQLPIKNKTLTYSYLLVRKSNPHHAPGTGRLIGDQLEEKGKTRQMFCRSSDREFLAWMHRNGTVPIYYRGNTYQLPTELQTISNEIRVQS